MKKIKHLLPLLLIAVLLMGLLPLGAFAQEEADTDPAEATPTPAILEDIVSSESSSEETSPPAETDAPAATPAPEPTAEPAPTTTPTAEPDPTEDPEIDPSDEDGPSVDEAWEDGPFADDNSSALDKIYAAASSSATISAEVSHDSSGNTIKYQNSFSYDGRTVGGSGIVRHILYANGQPAYCLEPGKYLSTGCVVSTSAATLWNSYSTQKRDAIKLALLCGAEGNSNSLSGSYGSKYTATQMIIWEFIVGVRSTSSPYTLSDSKVINTVCYNGANSEVKTVYNQIVSAMQTYNVLPSFCSALDAPPPSHKMTYQGGDFTVTLTDSRNVLSNFDFTSTNSSLRFSVSGNQLTISSPSAFSGAKVNVTRKNAVSASSTITAYGGSGLQETIIGIEATGDTSGYFNVSAQAEEPPAPSTGQVKIIKTADDGHVQGITFTLTGNGKNLSGTTDASGYLTLSGLEPGSYTVTESVPSGYVADRKSISVTVRSGKTTTIYFHNTPEKGELKIIKTSDDGKVSGIQFTVRGGSVNQTVTSGSDGTITVPDLAPGTYTITEQVPAAYVCDNPSQTVTVENNKTATVNFANKLKMWRVAVTKVDAEANVRRSSGATLVGAVYGIYKDSALLDSYTIDESDQFVTKLYPCGTGYELKEITPPTGYTLDPNSYPVGLEPGAVQLAANDTAITVKEQIIKGKLVIVKQDADTQTPLAGAVFTVYDETGATVTEATTGEDGTATVDSLPYGTYTAKETKAPDGYLLDDSTFDFTIETDGQEVQLTRDNYPAIGSITVHKVDTQGNTLSGASYLLEWSQDGGPWQPVTFRDSTTAIAGGCTSLGLENGQLTTGADGTVKFDGLVANGKVQYRLTEIKAPEGLSLLKDPVFQGTLPFDAATGPLYDIAYTVTNTRITTLPQTGSTGLLLPVTVGTALLGMAGCAGFFVVRSRKKSKSN